MREQAKLFPSSFTAISEVLGEWVRGFYKLTNGL